MIKHSLTHTPKNTQNITKIIGDRNMFRDDVNQYIPDMSLI